MIISRSQGNIIRDKTIFWFSRNRKKAMRNDRGIFYRRLKILLSAFVLLIASACEAQYSNPPSNFQDSDLVGTWEAQYMEWGIDKLILKADGTYEQTYRDFSVEDYVYETPWNEWSVEYFPDGRARLHLKGARYYFAGIRIAELDGMSSLDPESSPSPFYDPVTEGFLSMVGELVLNVRENSSGELVLLHMWTDFDREVAIIGGKAEEFHCVETPLINTKNKQRNKQF